MSLSIFNVSSPIQIVNLSQGIIAQNHTLYNYKFNDYFPSSTGNTEIHLEEKTIAYVLGEKVLGPVIEKVNSVFCTLWSGIEYVNKLSIPPGVSAFGWSDLDPTNKNGALRKGLKEADPMNKHSEVRKGLRGIDPTNKNSALRKGIKKLGEHIEGGRKNVVKLLTGEHKINPKAIEKAFQKAGGDVKDEWDRVPPQGKAVLVTAAAAAVGYGAVYLVAQGTVLSLGITTSQGVVLEVLTYSTASGLQVAPAVSGGALSVATWVNYYDEINKSSSEKSFEESKTIPLGELSDENFEVDFEGLEPLNFDQISLENTFILEPEAPKIEIVLGDNQKFSLGDISSFYMKPDHPKDPPWIEPDHPIRQIMPNIPAGGDSHQRRIIRRHAERLEYALQGDWGKTMMDTNSRSISVHGARVATLLTLIHDFIKIPVETSAAAQSFLKQALLNEYGGCDYPTISSPSFDSNLYCAAEKQEIERKKAAELYQSMKNDMITKNPKFGKYLEQARQNDPEGYEKLLDDMGYYLP